MRCTNCYQIIPKDAEVCTHCGKRYASGANRSGSGFLANEIPQTEMNDQQLKEYRKAHTSKTAKIQKIGRIVIVGVVLAIVILILFDVISGIIQRKQVPVPFSQSVKAGDPVYCYLEFVYSPEYTTSQNVLFTENLYNASTVLCHCVDEDGNSFWMVLDYGTYKEYFSPGKDFENCKVIGTAVSTETLFPNDTHIADKLVFEFRSVDPPS